MRCFVGPSLMNMLTCCVEGRRWRIVNAVRQKNAWWEVSSRWWIATMSRDDSWRTGSRGSLRRRNQQIHRRWWPLLTSTKLRISTYVMFRCQRRIFFFFYEYVFVYLLLQECINMWVIYARVESSENIAALRLDWKDVDEIETNTVIKKKHQTKTNCRKHRKHKSMQNALIRSVKTKLLYIQELGCCFVLSIPDRFNFC